jgi:hypothetical protein
METLLRKGLWMNISIFPSLNFVLGDNLRP